MLVIAARLAWRNIFYNPKKSMMAFLAVGACYFSLNMFQGYIAGTEQIFEDSYAKRSMLGNLLVKRTGSSHMMNIEESWLLTKEEQEFIQDFLSKDKNVSVWSRFLRVNGTITNGVSSTVVSGFGHDVAAGKSIRAPQWSWNALAGRPLESEVNSDILLGHELAKLLGCTATGKNNFITGKGGYKAEERPFQCEQGTKLQLSSATFSGQANAVDVETKGIVDAMFREVDLRYIYLPLSVAQRLMDTDKASFIAVRLSGESNKDREAALVESFSVASAKRGFNLTMLSWHEDELGDFYRKTRDFLFVFRNFMVLVILGVALLSIFNTFFRNVQERTREIGTLRTLGFRRADIRKIFVMETLFLTFLGAFIGGLISILLAWLINSATILYKVGLLTQPVPFLVSLSPLVMLASLILVILVAFVAVCIPLLLSERKQITESLAYV